MSTITASIVKELRDKTNCGMMDCKEALAASDGDLEAAEDYLRKKGIASAGKKASRTASEGVICSEINTEGKVGVLAEINCETDFVAKNDNFQGFVTDMTSHLIGSSEDSLEAVMAESYSNGEGSVEEGIKSKIAELGENLLLKRFTRYNLEGNGIIGTYIHLQGKVGVLVEVGCKNEASASNEDFRNLVKDITLHIAAADPTCVSRDQVDPSLVEKEKEIFAEQMKDKPAEVIDKIIGGKIEKFYSTICLLEQGFIKDPDMSVLALLEKVGSEIGDSLSVRRYTRFAIGEES